ncbi:MAG: CCA tRNA nucleotidyltransferase [Candidatus Omnitrophica bacterium]|nr:CCA tRNA nucleotidyltransferase [Candidatus Omnitrophota bacterium]
MTQKLSLEEKLPAGIVALLKTAGEIAAERGESVYLVGGCVRDLLMGSGEVDVDIVVEGDGPQFARDLAGKVQGEFQVHQQFGTATVILPGGLRVDVASSRLETYSESAAYPKVKAGSIQDDLARRDFSINAMAVSLMADHWGEILDLHKGQQDLEQGLVRVLHDKSFEDDPSRMLRAIRFLHRFAGLEGRAPFRLEDRTAGLMEQALEGGYLRRLNAGRIRKEIVSMANEKNPLDCLLRLTEFLERAFRR